MIGKITTTIFGLLLLGTMFGGIFHMSHETQMNNAPGGCSFMSPTESVCSMNALDHLDAWSAIFLTIIPSLTLLLFFVAVVFFILPTFLRTTAVWEINTLFYISHLRQRQYNFPQRALQDLFARGILHPKLY